MNKRIAYVTDIHLDEAFPISLSINTRKNWKIILNDIASKGINQIIFGGDIGEKSSNQWFFESLKNYKISLSLGNHDYFKDVRKHYNFDIAKNQSELYYIEEEEDYKFIFLDSSAEFISKSQFNWLKQELSTPKHIILFIHHPILPVPAEVDKRFALKDRDQIVLELLNLENKVTVFSGHYHFEDERNQDNIKQYITPASSYQVEKTINEIKVNNNSFGYRIIELSSEEIKTDLVMFP